MRCMQHLKKPIWYAAYAGREPIVDEYGNSSGEYTVIYDDPVLIRASVSAATGSTETEMFGQDLSYDKKLFLDNSAPDVDEYGIFWIDATPELDEDGKLSLKENGQIITPHDYVVVRVAKQREYRVVALRKVEVS